jgi:hypothetical protein
MPKILHKRVLLFLFLNTFYKLVNLANANVASIGKYLRKCEYFCISKYFRKCEYSLFILVMKIPRRQAWCDFGTLVSFGNFGKGKLDQFTHIKYVLYIK